MHPKKHDQNIFFIIKNNFLSIYTSISICFYLSRDLPSLERLETFDPAMLSTLYDRNGEVIGEFYIQKRVFVDIEDMPNI